MKTVTPIIIKLSKIVVLVSFAVLLTINAIFAATAASNPKTVLINEQICNHYQQSDKLLQSQLTDIDHYPVMSCTTTPTSQCQNN